MKVFYSEKMVAKQGKQSFGGIQSPSARKPKEVADALRSMPNIEFVEPNPISIDDIKLCHDPKYVDDVMELREENGFGTKSKEICDSLLYTNGAMYDAAKSALEKSPTCALVSGFHHAGYYGWRNYGWFCTFNGLMITATKLLKEGLVKNVAIVDCDAHWGNGTDNILRTMIGCQHIRHFSFGKLFKYRSDSVKYMKFMNESMENWLTERSPDIIIYQAGADVHIDDPYGGLLTTQEMIERDTKMFAIAKKLNIPIAWDLAGGYQIGENDSIQKVIDLHINTFKACAEIYK